VVPLFLIAQTPHPKQESTKQDLDPLAMSGKIGFYGVGGQHSVIFLLLCWAFQGPQEHRRSRDLENAEGRYLLTAVEFV